MISLLFLSLLATPTKGFICHNRSPVIKEGRRWKVTIDVYCKFSGTYSNLNEVRIYTKDKRFAKYLADCKTHPLKWIEKFTLRYDCRYLFYPLWFTYYEKQMGKFIRYQYWKATKRWVAKPDIMANINLDPPFICTPP